MKNHKKHKRYRLKDFAKPEFAGEPKYTPGSDTPYENMCFNNFGNDEDTDFKFD